MKAILEAAFRYCLVPSLQLGMPSLGLPPLLLAAEPPGAAFPAQRLETRFEKAFSLS
ncbi:hypothetical protein [Nostoc sp. NZL]|uniref:hypothetical protein n=1 Tax=Nostoc sp. NZL TaxID=2650612 RepID=UPI0018C5EAC0|nr:hypothetical protein [Nostoc sp. NZL]